MSKKSHLFLGLTAIIAVSIVSINIWVGTISIPSIPVNTASVSQSVLDKVNSAKPPFPEINLNRSARGEEIITALGDKLPEVASWYRMSEEEFKKNAKDNSLRADKKGRLFFVDENIVAKEDITSIGTGSLNQGGLLPLDQTFVLHSKPGSSKTIYLDFTGHLFLAGKSAWSSTDFNAPAFDTDGSPTTFNDGERQLIQEVWFRVAEDYLAFDVDVTTEEPTADKLERTSSSDNIYGNRVLISPSSVLHPNAGGVSYIGIFDDVGDYYKPSLVFPENLAWSAKYIGQAASHESGHALGLTHDGQTNGSSYYTGQGNWAPIMGVGYYKNLVQWSKGEYSLANNLQDDLQVMQVYGLSYRPDDYGNTISSAGNATVLGNSISAAGVIERTGDVDYLKFNTNAGDISVTVRGAIPAPTLDADITLYDGRGQAISQQVLSGTIFANVPAGTYYVSVRGVGRGDPAVDGYSNYGSLGQYYIDGVIVGTNNNPPVVSVSANPTAGSNPLTVQFSSAGSYDPDGGSISYAWDFGDGTYSSEANPVKIYSNGGVFNATLTVTDVSNLSSSRSTQISVVNQAPIASFSTSYSSPNIPVYITLDASASSDSDGTIASYAWDFGDGTYASGKTATHTYSKAGTYAIKLTVTDNGGLTGTKTVSLATIDPNVVNAPSALSGSTGGKVKNQVTLKWTDNSANETMFYIERATAVKTGTPTYQVIGQTNQNVTSYIDPVPSNTYYYRVRAYNGSTGMYSSYSNVVQVRVR